MASLHVISVIDRELLHLFYHNEIVVLVLEMEVMEARKGVMEARIEV